MDLGVDGDMRKIEGMDSNLRISSFEINFGVEYDVL